MANKIILTLISFLSCAPLISHPAFCATQAVEFLCETGIIFYRAGRYDEALMEFKKALMLEPSNQTAKTYINRIFKQEMLPIPVEEKLFSPPIQKTPQKIITKQEAPPTLRKEEFIFEAEIRREIIEKRAREKIINKALDGLSKKESKGEAKEKPLVLLTGEYRLSMGVNSKDVIWKDANADRVGVPREKNWRYLWGDERHNTYDPKIYDSLRLDMQTQFENPLNAFMEITIDPWTFIGKNHVTIRSTGGTDSVDMDLKYWSADNRTINEVYRSKNGNIINLKQIKVDDGKTTITTPTGLTNWGTNFNSIQPMEINRDYRPIRKLWFDYKQDDYAIKFFPISDQYEALTTDDPLRISNNHVYWEESPWLDEYESSRIFVNTDQPLKKGRWVRRLSFFAKDSDQNRLTFLRGASFKSDTGAYSLESTVATPLSLWNDYSNSNSAEAAARLKVPIKNDLQLGLTTASKVGLNRGSAEALNQVEALDLSYRFSSHHTIYGEIAESHTDIQEAKGFDTTYDGVAAKLGFNYDSTKENKKGIYRNEIYLAHMDGKFYPGLSNYRYTRRDEPTFSRHIYFGEIKEDDKTLIWGDGIDRGRNVVGFKLSTKSFNEQLDTDIKYRNVHRDSGKYVESVLRTESKCQINSQLTTKFLGYYQHLPKTYAGYDPIIYAKTMYSLTDYFSEEDTHPENANVIDDKDPSVGAFGLGAKYDFTEQLSLEGIYERTNDPLDFPRGLLNDTKATTETRDDITWDKVMPFLYDQKFFDLPPYHYYNIAKTKFVYTPTNRWEFILGYTFNENKYASGIDDNINHVGLEVNFLPSDKLRFWFKYIYSKLIDVYKQNKYQSSDFYEGHHNVFLGSDYNLNKDENFTFLYGEFVGYNDPYEQTNWSLSALDTQHIFRLFYKRKF